MHSIKSDNIASSASFSGLPVNRSPFDHDSIIYKLMKYLFRIEEHMSKLQWVWFCIDWLQFLTILTSLLGQVYMLHQKKQGESLFQDGHFLNVFFNYSEIYDELIIGGAISAFIVLMGLVVYLFTEYCLWKEESHQNGEMIRKRRASILKVTAFINTVAIGLFEACFQIMANNLINIVTKIFKKELSMEIDLITFLTLNLIMMVFVSVFNSDRRIFRFSLVTVSLCLNTLPFTATCLVLVVISLWYQNTDHIPYKKFMYWQIIVCCIWAIIESNDGVDENEGAQFESQIDSPTATLRFVYLGLGFFSMTIIVFGQTQSHIKSVGYNTEQQIAENNFLIKYYNKKLKKEEKSSDKFKADLYFGRYYEMIKKQSVNFQSSHYLRYQDHTIWEDYELKEQLLEKIHWFRKRENNLDSEIVYFEWLLLLKTNILTIMIEVFKLMKQHQKGNILQIFKINRLTNRIEKQFEEHQTEERKKSSMGNSDSQKSDKSSEEYSIVLKVTEITDLENLYNKFYSTFANAVAILIDFYESLETNNGNVDHASEEKVKVFALEYRGLQRIIQVIEDKNGAKQELKLFRLLTEVSDPYIKRSSQSGNLFESLKNKDQELFNFSYIVIGRSLRSERLTYNVKYSSVMFSVKFGYKADYLIGENVDLILAPRFGSLLNKTLKENAEKQIFSLKMPILSQKGFLEVIKATFYLMPEFKEEVTYTVKIDPLSEVEDKSIFLLNCQNLCFLGFNQKMVTQYRINSRKISDAIADSDIQFHDLFISQPSEQKDIVNFLNNTKNNPDIKNIKTIIKLGLLSTEKKKNFCKSIILEQELIFNIEGALIKVFKTENTSNNNSVHHNSFDMHSDKLSSRKFNKNQQNTMNFEQNKHSKRESLQNVQMQTTQSRDNAKDLKRAYKDEQFFCPIPNPYKPRILEMLNRLKEQNRCWSSVNVIRYMFLGVLFVFTLSLPIFKQGYSSIQTAVTKSQQESQSLNIQYASLMNSFYHSYMIRFMVSKQPSFKELLNSLSEVDGGDLLFENLLAFHQSERKFSIREYGDSYMDYPRAQVSSQALQFLYSTQFYTLKGNTDQTTVYEIIFPNIDSEDQSKKSDIANNFDLLEKILSHYSVKASADLQGLEFNLSFLLIACFALCVALTLGIYFLIWRLAKAKFQVLSLYREIPAEDISKSKKKLMKIKSEISKLCDSEENIDSLQNDSTQRNKQPLLSSLSSLGSSPFIQPSQNSFGSSQSANSRGMFKIDKIEENDEQQSEELIKKQNAQNLTGKTVNSVLKTSRKIQRLNHSLANSNPEGTQQIISMIANSLGTQLIYLLFLCVLLAYVLFDLSLISSITEQYSETFRYFEKLRDANLQFRLEFVQSMHFSYYTDVKNQDYIPGFAKDSVEKKTHFDFERPSLFDLCLQIPENGQNSDCEVKIDSPAVLCSYLIVNQVSKDPLARLINCEDIGYGIVKESYAKVETRYEQILTKLWQENFDTLIEQGIVRDHFIEVYYEHLVFKAYFERIFANYERNMERLKVELEGNLIEEFLITIAICVMGLLSVHLFSIQQLQKQVAMTTVLIRMIPSKTLMSIKMASILKKRNVFEMIGRL